MRHGAFPLSVDCSTVFKGYAGEQHLIRQSLWKASNLEPAPRNFGQRTPISLRYGIVLRCVHSYESLASSGFVASLPEVLRRMLANLIRPNAWDL